MDKPPTSPVQHFFDGTFNVPMSALGGSSHSVSCSGADLSSPATRATLYTSASGPGGALVWRNRNAGAVVPVVAEDGVAPSRVGDTLLSASRYQGRVLDLDSEEARRTNQFLAHDTPGLMGRRKRYGAAQRGGDDGAENEEDEQDMHGAGVKRVVVDGVEDLQHATAGLLARHLGEELNTAPSALSAQSVHYLATEPSYASAFPPSARYAKTSTSTPPTDDRVTPQALHMLLRKGQQRAAHKLTQNRLNGRYYTFTAGPGTKEAAAAALEMAEANGKARQTEAQLAAAVASGNSAGAGMPQTALSLPAVAGRKGVKRSKKTVQGRTPQDFVRATHTASVASVNPLLQGHSANSSQKKRKGVGTGRHEKEDVDAEQLAFLRAQLARSGISSRDSKGNSGKAVLAANIAYLEPPSITTAHNALYRTNRDYEDDGVSRESELAQAGVNASSGPTSQHRGSTADRGGKEETPDDADVVESDLGDVEDDETDARNPAQASGAASQRRFAPYVAPHLQPTIPPASLVSAVMTYPPPPVVYASAEDEKKARDRHRLRPIRLRSKEDMAAANANAAVTLPKGVREALISTTGGVGGGAHPAAAHKDRGDGPGDQTRDDKDDDDDDDDPYGEHAKKFGVEMDIDGVQGGLELDFAFSAALRGDDRQLVEQLAQQYGEQCLRRQVQARREAQQKYLRTIRQGGAAPQTLVTLTEKSLRAHVDSRNDASATASTSATLTIAEPPFSVLESVLAVSREFEKMRPALLNAIVCGRDATADATGTSVHGVGGGGGGGGGAKSPLYLADAAVPLSSSVLARERRALVDGLTAFTSSRIPGRFWITLKERAAAAAVRQAGAAAAASASAGAHHAPTSTSTVGAALSGYVRNKVPIVADFSSTRPSHASHETGTTAAAEVPSDVSASVIAVSHQPRDGSMISLRQGGEANGAVDACVAERGEPSPASVLFPAARPTGRAQVYLLAETLDHMLLNDSSLLKAVTDPEVAYRILPPLANKADNTPNDGDRDHQEVAPATATDEVSAEWLLAHTSEAQHPLLDIATRTEAENNFRRYTEAAAQVLAVLDAGLVELVRQVACQCVERGALLDSLRQTLVDLTSSSLHVLAHAKERANEEAVHSLQLRCALEQERRARLALESSEASAKREVARLEAENERLGEKAAHLDLLIARAEAKRNRFDLEADDDDQTEMLKALEEEINEAAMKAMNDLCDAKAGLGTGAAGAVRGPRGEAPSVAEARRRQNAQKETTERLYHGSYTLLRAMTKATEAMNEATAPLYNEVALNKVSLNANVAAGRWAQVARAVGAFEAEKKHRHHVFQVFSDWCDRYQSVHRLDGDDPSVHGNTDFLVGLVGDGEAGDHAVYSSHDAPGRALSAAEALMSSSSALMGEGAAHNDGEGSEEAAFMCSSVRQSSQSARLSLQGRRHHIQDLVRAKIRKQQEDHNAPESSRAGPDSMAAVDPSKSDDNAPDEVLHQVLERIQYATADDLLAMGVDDCSVDEVNAMFARNFDFRAYLFTPWEPQQHSHTLDMPDVVDMVHDITMTMEEMTLRMKALAQSAVVRRGAEPPMQPPSRPGDLCVLCGRRDGAAEEKRRRQETMRVIAHQVQLRINQMKEKCQQAEADREVARDESRRLRAETNAILQREQLLRKQVRDLTEQMGTGSGKTVVAGRQGRRSSSGSTRASPLGTPSRGRSPHKRAAAAGMSGDRVGSGGGGRTRTASGSLHTPVTSILALSNSASTSGGAASSLPLATTEADGYSGVMPRLEVTRSIMGGSGGMPSGNAGVQGRRRLSSVVGIVAPDDAENDAGCMLSPHSLEMSGASGSGTVEGAGSEAGSSPLRRYTLPPSSSKLGEDKADGAK